MIVKSIDLREDAKAGRLFVWLTGSEDGWTASQNFCDVYDVSGLLVAINPLNQRPMFVVRDRDELLRMVKTITGKI